MKYYKLIFIFFISILITNIEANDRGPSLDCLFKISPEAKSVMSLCGNVDDIICKDVKKNERRSCEEKDKTILNKNMSASDLANFAKGCFNSSVNSFENFFTEFIPELLKSIWQIAIEGVNLTKNSISSDTNAVGWFEKTKGIYESTSAITADIYEAAGNSPVDFAASIWKKLESAIGPAVTNYDCLSPQIKVEKICGFVSGWIVPPVILAKILVRGAKYAKTLISSTDKISQVKDSSRLQRLLIETENRKKLTVKQYHNHLSEYRKLGYTEDEFNFLLRVGVVEKIKPGTLVDTLSPHGKIQKGALLEDFLEYQKITNKEAPALIVGASEINARNIRRSEQGVISKQKVFVTQSTLIKDLQKAAEQIENQIKKNKFQGREKLSYELELVRQTELNMQKDLLKTATDLKRTGDVFAIQERILKLRKLVKP
jgi:hypothetical protein